MNDPIPQLQPTGRWGRLAWIPIPLLLVVITVLWVAGQTTAHESRNLLVLCHLIFTWLGSFCICVLTARGFLGGGQPGLLMFGCGSLLWGTTSLASAILFEHPNMLMTVHNLGVFAAAWCHLAGLLWRGRLRHPGRWLLVGYAATLMAAALLVHATKAGSTPLFFVQGEGGTPLRQATLLVTIAIFAWVAWQMIDKSREQTNRFFHWYGLGLALVACALTAGLLLTVQDSILSWAGRLTQYLGSTYLFIAAYMVARQTDFLSLDEAAANLHQGHGTADWRRPATLSWVVRYGLAFLAVVLASVLRFALEAKFGPGLPTYILFYPAIMLTALLGGFGPGAVATLVADFVAVFWILSPHGMFNISSPMDRLGLMIFTTMGLIVSAAAEIHRRNREKVSAYQREAALHESRARLATFAEATFEGIVQSTRGRIVDCNAQFARMLDYPPADLIGMEIANLVAPEDLQLVMENIHQGKESMTEHAMLRRDGTRIIVEAHGKPAAPGSTVRHTALRDISDHKRTEVAERARREELETLMETLPVAVFISHDTSCQEMTGNPAAMELLRLPPGTNPSKSSGEQDECPSYEIWADGRHLAAHELPMQRAAATGQVVHDEEFEIIFPNNTSRQILGSALPLFDGAGAVRGCIGAFMDITQRKLGQEELRQLNRSLRVLNDSNRAQLFAKTETELLQEICRIITEVCGHVRVWIGYAENDPAKTVRLAASAGFDADYLSTAHISWGDNEHGRGPTGTAIRSGHPSHCDDFLNDPRLKPWRADAIKHGFASSLAVPLMADGVAFGAISMYSRQPARFTPDEIKLLSDLAGDLAFGITTLRLREKHQQAQSQLENRVQERTNELQQTLSTLEVEIRNRRRLEREILEISEREQSRLGQDLHDGLGQELAGISILGDVHAKLLQAQDHPLALDAARISTHIRAAIDSTRRLAKGHYPIELDRYGLLIALKDLATQTSRLTGIHCSLRQCGAEAQFEKSAEIHLYRIVQECLANAVKHAKPHHITIESMAGDGTHTFTVTDDGVGFERPAITTGMGLHLMEYRARMIHAKITIEQPAQGGCRVTCQLTA